MRASEAAACRQESAGGTPHPGSASVLVVDDEPLVREVLTRCLEGSGYGCIGVGSGEAALMCLRKNEYGLLLTDVMMPGMSGIDLMNEARRLIPDLAVILVTSVLDVDLAVESLKHGAYDYLTKPFDLGQVLMSVERALERRQLLQEGRLRRRNLEVEVADRTRQLRDALEVIQQTYHSTLVALGTALDSRESHSAGHSLRVAKYAVRLGRQLGLSQAQLRILEQAAILHDIGKLGVPEGVLRKNGKLTPEEEAVIRRHPEIGFRILSGIRYLSEAALVIRHHQERYDGTGYPDGLRGNQIPLCARIFAVAYTFDRLTSDRPYRAARSFEEAREEVEHAAGTQLDPCPVRAFLEIPLEEWHALRRTVDESVSSGTGARKHALSAGGGAPVFAPAGSPDPDSPPETDSSESPVHHPQTQVGGFP
jgi:putative nucleotidyltransferase with HDIG domain